jgi:putative ABC transport system permease protein
MVTHRLGGETFKTGDSYYTREARETDREVCVLSKAKAASVALGETIRMAFDTLSSHKLRTFLTLLGVILAVTTLVAVMSVITGLNSYVADKIANLGANAFVIDRFGIITNFDDFIKAQKRPLLTAEDLQLLREEMKLAQHVAAIEATLKDIRYGNQLSEDVRVFGVTPDYAEVRAISTAIGRPINETDDTHRSPVCVLGADVAQKFFPNTDPIGKTIRAGSESYDVVGVATAQGSVLGQSQDNFILIPFGTFQKTWHFAQSSITLFVQARSADMTDAAQDEARQLLRARRHVPYRDPDNFGIIAPSSITGLWEDLTAKIFEMAVGIVSVFLVVGGIVVMNIMLASVVERTREIGIRKALGARRRHIITQFLAEAAFITALGGTVGIILAYGIGALVTATTSFPIKTPISAVVIALTLSTSVGLFFGIYPAVRASRLDPIEALRQEV